MLVHNCNYLWKLRSQCCDELYFLCGVSTYPVVQDKLLASSEGDLRAAEHACADAAVWELAQFFKENK